MMKRCDSETLLSLANLLALYLLKVELIDAGIDIPGSFWGDSEAGLVQDILYVRSDTPLHSALHEACHYICMDEQRRINLHTDAAGDYDEENGVCYLQIVLANYIKSSSDKELMQDMDEWGYTFRLGSTQKWYETDAEDARSWLLEHQLIDLNNEPLWLVRK